MAPSYGDFDDNAERFIFFSRAVVEMIEALKLEFDVCHAHEWQSGLVPVYLRTIYNDRPRPAAPAGGVHGAQRRLSGTVFVL